MLRGKQARKLSIRYELLLSMLCSLRFNHWQNICRSICPASQIIPKHFDLQWLGSPQLRPPRFGTTKKPSAFHKPPGSPERHVAADILSTWFATMPVDRENEYGSPTTTNIEHIILKSPTCCLYIYCIKHIDFFWHWHILKLYRKVAFYFHPSNLLGQAHSWARYS